MVDRSASSDESPSGSSRICQSTRSSNMSAQQFMRSQYKQQMIPPRTWKQAEAERERIDRASEARNVNSRATYLAAAAKAGSVAAASMSTARIRPQPLSTLKVTLPDKKEPSSHLDSMKSAISGASANSSIISRNSHGSESPIRTRGTMVRRSSSSSMLSHAAAKAAQSTPRWGSSSTTSKSVKSGRSSRRNSTADDFVADTMKTYSISAEVNRTQHSNHIDKFTESQTTKQKDNLKQAHASAAARASISRPIDVAPRVFSSSRFVSSISQVLRLENDPTLEKDTDVSYTDTVRSKWKHTLKDGSSKNLGKIQNSSNGKTKVNPGLAREIEVHRSSPDYCKSFKRNASNFAATIAASNIPTHRKSSDSTRSWGSIGSYGCYCSDNSNAPSSIESERRRMEFKNNALQAAVTAGTRVEANMASIHMQVNAAVQAARSQRNKRDITKKYRPTASWSIPSRFKRFRKQQTNTTYPQSGVKSNNDSGLPQYTEQFDGYDNTTEITKSSYHQMYPFHGELPSTTSLHTVCSAQSSIPSSNQLSSSSPEIASHHPVSNTFASHHSTPRLLKSLRSVQRQRKLRENDTYKPGGANSQYTGDPSFGYQDQIATSSTKQSSSSDTIQSLNKSHMRLTLREDTKTKIFNEDKPWKSHRFQTCITDKERRRYEGLWATNKGSHLPWLYIPAQYQSAWDEAVAVTLRKNYTKNRPNSQNHVDFPVYGHRSAHSASSVATASSGISAEQEFCYKYIVPSLKCNSTWGESSSGGNFECKTTPGLTSPETQTLGRQCDQSNTMGNIDETSDLHDVIEANDRKSFESFDLHENLDEAEIVDSESIDSDFEESVEVFKEVKNRINDIHGYAVSRLWRRSRLSEETLAEIWDLVDTNKDGTIERSGFVVGMWLCDQCLYGRKLPTKITPEVWQSAGRLNVKIRVKPRKSKFRYVRRLPSIFGNAMGLGMNNNK